MSHTETYDTPRSQLTDEVIRTFVAEIVTYAYPGDEGGIDDPGYLAQDVDTIITAAEKAGYENSAELQYFLELAPDKRLAWFK